MFGLAIHGGAGTLPRAEMSAEPGAAVPRRSRRERSPAGFAVLEGGGTSLDAVTRAVVVLEDNPLFNAGRGAVFTLDGRNELDASIMDGATLEAGAVCGVTRIKNPVELARAVMEHSEFVLLSGTGAEEFALRRGFEFVPPQLFLYGGALAAARAHPRRRCRRVAVDHLPRGHGRRGGVGLQRAGWRRPPRPAA